METRSYKLGALDTPASLRRCSDKGILLPVTAKGNLEVLHKPLVGFFCSVRCPGDIILKTYDLARALRKTDVTIVGGFQSPMEKECLDLLLRGSVSFLSTCKNFLQVASYCGPYAKARSHGALDAVANGDDGVETVEVRVVMLTVSGSYKEFLYN